MYKTFIFPLKSAFALAALFILAACGGITIDLNSSVEDGHCLANPFEAKCDADAGIGNYRALVIKDCANNPSKANTQLCLEADVWVNPPSDDENGATGAEVVVEVVDNTPKETGVKIEFDKDGFTKTDKKKGGTITLEIVDLCTNPATSNDKQCTHAVLDCINHPFSGRCQGDNVLGNFVKDGVTLSKAVVLQDKRAEDCRTGRIDRALCQNLNVQKQRCAGAAFSTDAICSAVAYSVCKADAFDPLCGEKDNFAGVYFSERSNVCYEDPKNPHCTGRNGHVAVVCSEYPFDRLCTGNANYDIPRETACRAGTATTRQCGNIVAGVCSGDPFDPLCGANYDDARANACETDPTVSSDCPVVELVELEEEGTELEVTVNVCLNNPFDSTCVGVQYDIDRTTLISTCVLAQIAGQRTAQCDAIFDEARPCLINPFDSACDTNDAIGTYIGLLRSTRVEFCNSSLRIASYCTGVPAPDTTPVVALPVTPPAPATPQVTASVWADSFAQGVLGDTTSTTPSDAQFLKSDESDAVLEYPTNTRSFFDIGRIYSRQTLTLDIIDGDAEDGFGVFALSSTDNLHIRYYAGILPGTNLGAPLTQTTGSAKWAGVFTLDEHDLSKSFVLNIEFNGTGGSIESLIQRDIYDYHTTGSFNNAGVITGNVQIGEFRNPNPANRGRNDSDHQTATLTGLIGEEGAVGAFVGNNTRSGSRFSTYAGGFVARPLTTSELGILTQTCADDPFDSHCALGYEAERRAVIERCIAGGNASDASCGSAVAVNYCIKYPFGEECADRLPLYYEQARTSRLNFCLSSGNADNALCTLSSTYEHICTNHPFSTQCIGDSDYRLIRRDACSGNPFAIRCAGDVYNDLRVSFCEGKVGTHSSCPAPTPQVTAKVWADSFDEDLDTAVSRYHTESQFLIGRATDLDSGRARPRFGSELPLSGNLNLADATFNGVALGGDRADGAAFFAIRRNLSSSLNYYSGILSGTNLGAPLTDTQGSAKWIGSFRFGGSSPTDFILNISFGTGAGAGEVEALVQEYSSHSDKDFHITGEFDDAGVITGTTRRGTFRKSNWRNVGRVDARGTLTGLIGEEGAVGTFFTGNSEGGFVARPSSAAELRTLAQTCADDPFHEHCNLGYESERVARIEHCIIGGNANDENCGSAKEWYSCIDNPFDIDCDEYFPQHYEQAQANRVAFCRTAGNAGNALCTVEDTFFHICRNYPFDAQCRGDNGYRRIRRDACTDNPFAPRCAGDVYNDLRVSFCEGKVGTHSSCPAPTPTEVTAEVWVDSFDEDLAHGVNAADKRTQFLIGKATDLDDGGVTPYTTLDYDYSSNLNLADATFNGTALGGDAADGVAFFAAKKNKWNYYGYAGILSGTNLGAPLTDTEGSAKWIGSFRIGGGSSPLDFVLNLSFGTGSGAGEIEALIQKYNYWYDYHIAGEFDDTGVITGKIRHGIFETNDPNNRGSSYGSNKLTGLIGEEGAIGAFFIRNTFGGFVARPSTQEELRTVEQTCADDPFHEHCNIGYESERSALVERCDLNPFISNCGWRYNDVREQACISNRSDTRCPDVVVRVCNENVFSELCNDNQVYLDARKTHCRSVLWDEPYCEILKTTIAFCTSNPFDAQCLVNNDYTPLRRNACSGNPFATRCAGDVYNDLRVTFCENNAGNSACPRPVVPTTDRVTASDWVDSFDGNLRKTPDTNYYQIDRDPQTGRRNSNTGRNDAQRSFLESNGNSLDTGTLSDSWYEQRDIKMEILNFDTATFDGKYLNGDVEDGLVFFTGVRLKTEGVINARYHSHTGIISTTDLGAPLNQTGSATWHGTIALGSLYDDDTDFSLDIVFKGATGGTLSAFISQNARSWFLNERRYHAKLAATFDANGVITGTLDEGIFIDSDPNKPKQPGPGNSNPRSIEAVSGLIGEEGAIGAFQGGGGFVVRPSEAFMSQAPLVNNARVTTADWLESFDVALSAAPAYRNEPTPYDIFSNDNPYKEEGVNDPNEFLKGSKTGMSVRNGYGVKYKVLTLADSTLDGQSLGGDATDGLAIARDRYLGSHYASILSGTDLGAPLTQTQGTVNWYGTFRVFGWHHVNRDFELRINFGAGNGAGTLNAFVRSQHVNTYHYRINGVFDDNGVITGAVELGNFGGQDAALPTHGRKSGELRGLIGEEGAIAVFISDENNFNGFSGGFVATPDLTGVVSAAPVADTSPNRVTTSDWLESFDVVPSATLDGDLNTRFLGKEEVSTGSDVRWYGVGNRGYEWITFAPVVRSGKSEAKNIRQGAFSASSKDGKYVYFAGILPNTDLGAPLISSDVPVYWHGRFQATLPYEIKKALTLKVSFNGGTNHVGEVEAFVKDSGDLYYHLKGDFDDKGVIKGTVKYGDISDRNNNPSRNGVLTGLIGQEGAAGAFVANINNGFGDYSGGFIARSNSVASPTATPTPLADTTPNRVTGRDWQAGFDKVPDAVPDTISSYYTRKNQFLRSTGGTLNTGVRGDNAPDVSILTLADAAFGNNRGDATDGVAMFEGRHRYAGVLTNTDLGAPVTQTTGTAEWEGRFQTTEMDAKDFTLEIDFRNREVEAFVHRRANYYYYMTGTFDRNGLIKGAVDSGDFTNGNRETPRYHGSSHPAEMRGLIGQEGAVGVFISDTNYSGYSGGFVARPTP